MEVVTSAEFQRKIGLFQDRALAEPVIVTRNGRERLVLMSAEEFHRLRQLSRRAMHVEDLSDREVAAIEASEVPSRFAGLDDELK